MSLKVIVFYKKNQGFMHKSQTLLFNLLLFNNQTNADIQSKITPEGCVK